jgi:pilus assembly protein Flp/PilA
MNAIRSLLRMISDEAGASSAEYALLLAIVGAGIILASIALGMSIAGSMNEASSQMNN